MHRALLQCPNPPSPLLCSPPLRSLQEKGKKGEAFVLVVWCVCAGLVLSVGSLCGFHLYLILHNLTTLELFRWFSLSKGE